MLRSIDDAIFTALSDRAEAPSRYLQGRPWDSEIFDLQRQGWNRLNHQHAGPEVKEACRRTTIRVIGLRHTACFVHLVNQMPEGPAGAG